MKVLVLGGGNSPERDVSIRSATAVSQALEEAGFENAFADPGDGLSVLDVLIVQEDIVFPILHGAGGEDGSIQTELEQRGLPYLGTDSTNSTICFDKWLTRKALQEAGLPVAKGELITEEAYESSDLRKLPHVVKAVGGGSSIGTLIVRDPKDASPEKLAEVFRVSQSAVIEELIEGTEITVPILDQSALPVIEIRPPEAGEFDYENKYNGKTKELCPPVSIDEALQTKAKILAEQVHKVTGARHLSRVDMIVRPSGDLIILEINTIPGMTNQSLYPKAAVVAGMNFPELMEKFVELVKRDYKL